MPLPFQDTPIVEAIQYDALLGGKRLHPLLMYATGRVSDAGLSTLSAPVAAVEHIHVCSLIHDDPSAMGDNDLRRDLPACHVKFGETNATLAGDALQMLTFSIISGTPMPKVADRSRVTVVSELV